MSNREWWIGLILIRHSLIKEIKLTPKEIEEAVNILVEGGML